MADIEIANRAAHVVRLVLERELRRVHADDDEAVTAVRVVPRLHVR